jgi:uncharacterized protein YqhQ
MPFSRKTARERIEARLKEPVHSVGGQAVMEGVMMRNQDRLAIAVRRPGGEIYVETWPWFTLAKAAWLKKPFVRGFPVLIETLINGIKALNFSANQALIEDERGEATNEEIKTWHLVLTLAASIGLALGLFVVVPHLFSLGMKALGAGGDVDGLSFHIWDGFFKLAIFLGYILAISFIPDIRRVFQYHGAEHKVIWRHEKGGELAPEAALGESRLHPRCGTAFLLFVLSISIVLHAVLVPLLLMLYSPGNVVLKHTYIVLVKLLLIIPISATAYEVIRFAGRHADNFLCKLMNGPGLMLQMLTTKEPDQEQIEVAIAALRAALAEPATVQAESEASRGASSLGACSNNSLETI